MQILATGDLHISPFGEFSRSLDAEGLTSLARRHIETAKWIRTLFRKTRSELLLLNGDLTSIPGRLDAPTIKLLELVEREWADVPRVVNVGNHDLSIKVGLHNLHLHSLLAGVHVVDEPVYQTGNLWVVPYTYTLEEQQLVLSTIPDGAVVAIHYPLLGAQMTPQIAEGSGLEMDELRRFRFVIASHYHLPQVRTGSTGIVLGSEMIGHIPPGSVVVTGTPMPHSFADTGEAYGVWFLDTETGESEFFVNPHAPVYVSETVRTMGEAAEVLNRHPSRETFFSLTAPKDIADRLPKEPNLRIRRTRPESASGLPRVRVQSESPVWPNLVAYAAHAKLDLDCNAAEEMLAPMIAEITAQTNTGPISFTRLQIKDFMSWGEADLDLTGSGLVLVSGTNHDTSTASSNGSGKSSLLEAIAFALYGSTFRSFETKDKVVRSGAVTSHVTVTLVTREGEFEVSRSRKAKGGASVSLRKRDGDRWVDISRGSAPGTDQAIVETFGLDAETFSTLAFFGSRYGNQFSLMGDADRKRFLGAVLGISQYEALRAKLRDRLGALTKEFAALDASLKAQLRTLEQLEGQVASEQDSIAERKKEGQLLQRELSGKIRVWKAESKGINEKIEAVTAQEATIREGLAGLVDPAPQIESLQREADSYGAQITRLEKDIERGRKDLAAAQRDLAEAQFLCPTCGQELPEVGKEEIRSKLFGTIKATAERGVGLQAQLAEQRELQQARLGDLEALRAKTGGLQAQREALNDQLREVVAERARLRGADGHLTNEIAQAEAQVAELKGRDYEAALRRLEGVLATTRKGAQDLTAQVDELSGKVGLAQQLDRMLSPQGVVSYLLDSALSSLNSYLDYLSGPIFGGDYAIALDSTRELAKGGEENRISIRYSTPAGSYSASSDGERRKADLAIFLAVNFLAGAQGMGCPSLAVLDEALDSLDAVAARAVVEAVDRFATEEGRRVFLVSHSPDVVVWVGEELRVEKRSGVSLLVREPGESANETSEVHSVA